MLRYSIVVLTGLLLCTTAARAQESPYVAHQERSIKALSEDEIQSYLGGEGMGFALAAELNAYPGPRHVLELADSLGLDSARLEAVQEIFRRMHEQATLLGQEIVSREASLDSAFAQRRITSSELRTSITELGTLRGELRYAHLAAHLEVAALLSEHEIHEYQRLRGYAGRHGTVHQPDGSRK